MTLETKFEALETQLATQHTAIDNALDSILTAMGAPPPTATVTLATIATQLTALNNNLIGIAIANGSFHSALLSLLTDTKATQLVQHNALIDILDLINTNTDTIISNNSLNAQRTIAAIYATFCGCATDVPLLSPPLDVTPTEIVDEAKCRRIQFYLSVFGEWLLKIANYGSSTGYVTGEVLTVLLSSVTAAAGIVATGAEVGAAAGPPGIVIGAVIGLIAFAIFTFGGSVLIDYATQFNDATLRDNMVQAMYAASNADEGYSAFKTTLLAGMSTIPAEIIYTLWWSAWSNDVYSGTPTVDDSAFDGSICAPASEFECTTIASIPITITGYGTRDAIEWPDPFPSSSTDEIGNTYDANQVLLGDFNGFTIRMVSGPGARMLTFSGSPSYTLVDIPYPTTVTITSSTTSLFIDHLGYYAPFTIEICPPA